MKPTSASIAARIKMHATGAAEIDKLLAAARRKLADAGVVGVERVALHPDLN